MNRDLAEKLVATCLDYSAQLDRILFDVRAKCEKDEFIAIRKSVGIIMGEAYTGIMRPIFHEHPDLEPEALRTSKTNRKPRC